MDITTLLIYIAMYIYGFSLTIWALFFDKRPTKTTRMASLLGLVGLSLTVVYVVYVLWTIGIK